MVAAGGSQRAWGLRLGLALAGTRVPAAPSPGHGGEGVLSEKTGSSDWFQGSRGPSFAQTQTLKKNLPIQPVVQMETPPARRSSESGSLSAMASKVTRVTGNVMGPYFAFCAVVDGIQYKTGLGQNKKESRSNAAKLALDELLQLDELEPRILEQSGPPPISAEPVVSPEPAYVSKVHYAGHHEVVAVGTGEYNCSQCIQPHGRVLHDTQGVVTARRSLLRYNYSKTALETDVSICDVHGYGLSYSRVSIRYSSV
ncbi:adenosine deaminase domain-containing protein 1-like [Heterocephalus glaber]|uniref:Adenosine deaminase domain-containing protein 1-like n=1 Tax=Heterocephalus glaber TaxID=10181 RepID=A0AAX6RUG6_HETGA|nr:adenosine deaminase domain-containing protein 1-like [Heterocephalus glaber]